MRWSLLRSSIIRGDLEGDCGRNQILLDLKEYYSIEQAYRSHIFFE